MEIERINENTVKFYISYVDIEDRGFEREEIWYNRERSEQLFWQMMDEVNYKEDFNVDGPLWIQVQALDKGLEIVVTKAQMHKNGENIELPINGEAIDLSVDEKMEQLLESKFGKSLSGEEEENEEEEEDDNVWVVINFNDFEDVIQLSYYLERCEETFNTIYTIMKTNISSTLNLNQTRLKKKYVRILLVSFLNSEMTPMSCGLY